MKRYINKFMLAGASLSMLVMTGCSDSYLEPDPMSFYEPTATYTNEAGLQSAMAMCDRHLLTILIDGNWNHVSLSSNYMMSDIGLYAKTDMGDGFQDNFAEKLTPTTGLAGGGDGNAFQRFWDQGYTGVKYANTILNYIDDVEGLDDATRNAYKGRAYFHRANMYYHLVLQFGDIPLVTKIISVPKQNYHSTSKEAIFQMLVHDLEFAAQNVPSQKDMSYVGMVNQEACMLLLAKCYLVTGDYVKAQSVCDDLINNHGLALMTQPFGTWMPSGNEDTWKITRNVIWDLNRPENVCDPANTEMIMPILNFNEERHVNYMLMRSHGVHWSNSVIRDPAGMATPNSNYTGNNGNFRTENDWVSVIGRGIGVFRTSPYYNKSLWIYDGEEDTQDLRHNRTVGNWVEMEDIRYNNPNSVYYGKNMQLYATEDYVDPNTGTVAVHAGDLLCSDTIRSWYPTPLYKYYIYQHNFYENRATENQLNGAQNTNDCANLYLFRLAEAYLVRAEAKFYQGNAAGAAQDVNVIRARANAKKMFTTVTIGDIMAERARELYIEEWRQSEMVRVSWCLAKSGQPDEWGNTYDINTWDKQSGTAIYAKGEVPSDGSYWYKRCIAYNIFNHGGIVSNAREWNFKIDKRNIFWPVPNSAITANTNADLRQNFGYDGYDANVAMWTNWEEAVADETNTEN